jgi:O-Antigen ligase
MVDLLRVTAGALGCLFIVAFQLQLLPFFSRLFVDDRTLWPIIYYGCWAVATATTALLLILQRSILLRTLPLLVVCALSAAVTFIHPIDLVAKNLLVGIIFVACAGVLAVASAPLALLRFSAAATILCAIVCLIDIFFTSGFTNSLGRAAGLSINPNVAGAGLFLGAASSFWAVPHRLRTAFLLITGAAILVTQSRSTLLAAAAVCGVVAADLIWTRFKGSAPRQPLQWISTSLLTLGLIVWIAAAMFTNRFFFVTAKISVSQIATALSGLETAPTESATRPNTTAQPGTSTSAAKSGPLVRGNVQGNLRSEETIKAIAQQIETEGSANTITARELLMERAFLSYKQGPLMGQGLAVAYELHPHNMFLLFAVAFGPVGWLVPLAFLALTAWWARSIQQLPLFLATFMVMMTSHDVLFTPGLLAPIVFGIAGLNWLRYPLDGAAYSLPALPYAALAAALMFAVGSIFTAFTTIFTYVPPLLPILVFCAFALWSACIWLWRGKVTLQTDGAARGN